MADDLKPCPCCGEDMARVINDNDFFRVRCDYCGLQTEVNYKDEEGAIDSWNMRSSDWHTGTPTEEGRYLAVIESPLDEPFYVIATLRKEPNRMVWQGNIEPLAWQKITPYEEKENGREETETSRH